MPSGTNTSGTNQRKPDILGIGSNSRKSFCVVLDEIRSDVETHESFAIKFSLLTKTPISKMKHIVRKLPAPIWSGEGRTRAEHIIVLIEQAGGKGSIVESGVSALVKSPPKEAANKLTCNWCGFPVKEGDTHCEFCLTPVGETGKSETKREGRKTAPSIPPKRLLCYIIVLIAGIIVSLATR